MIRVLVTGFGPFPGVPENPTAGLVAEWRARPPRLAPGVHLTLATIETAYEAIGPALRALAPEGPFDAALHFGVSGFASGFTIERRARNVALTGRPDARGHWPEQGVLKRGAADRPTRLPVERLVGALRRARVPVEVSDDAGGYLCNALFFTAVAGLVPGYAPPLAGFVHVPPVTGLSGPDEPGLISREVYLRGAGIVLAEVIAASRSARP